MFYTFCSLIVAYCAGGVVSAVCSESGYDEVFWVAALVSFVVGVYFPEVCFSVARGYDVLFHVHFLLLVVNGCEHDGQVCL